MCSVLRLDAKYNLPYEMLFNAVHNNSHGYGILLKDNNKIEIRQGLSEEPNPDEIYKILEDNKDIERWVHLRNASKGDVTNDNLQPFSVYSSNKRQVYFMHNGTINYMAVSQDVKDHLDVRVDTAFNSPDSDSRQFAYARLQPLLNRLKGENGMADITDVFIKDLLGAMWNSQNGRGVLVCNDLDPLYLNITGWEWIEDGSGGKFFASNDEYFKKLIRGKLFDQRKKEEEAKRPQTLLPKPSARKGVHPLACSPFKTTMSVGKMTDLLAECDLYTPEGYTLLNFLDYDEIQELIKHDSIGFGTMFMLLTKYLSDETKKNRDLERKHQAATLRIADLVQEIKKNGSASANHVG